MSKILFLGAPGNISSSTINVLFDQNHELYAYTLPSTPIEGFEKKLNFYYGDRNDFDKLKETILQIQPEIIIDYSCFTPLQCEQITSILENKVRQYIFLSTVDVYGYPLSQIPMPENGIRNTPNCKYAEDKSKCEDIIKAYPKGHLPYTIVRPAYSMGKQFLLTALSRDGGRYLISRLQSNKPIFSAGDGTALIHVSCAYNTGRMIAQLVDNTNALYEDYTCGHDTVMTYDDYLKLVARILGTKIDIVHIPSDFVYSLNDERTSEVLLNDLTRHNVFFDVSKFKALCPDFKWEMSIEDCMKTFINYQIEQNNIPDIHESTFEDYIIEEYTK